MKLFNNEILFVSVFLLGNSSVMDRTAGYKFKPGLSSLLVRSRWGEEEVWQIYAHCCPTIRYPYRHPRRKNDPIWRPRFRIIDATTVPTSTTISATTTTVWTTQSSVINGSSSGGKRTTTVQINIWATSNITKPKCLCELKKHSIRTVDQWWSKLVDAFVSRIMIHSKLSQSFDFAME